MEVVLQIKSKSLLSRIKWDIIISISFLNLYFLGIPFYAVMIFTSFYFLIVTLFNFLDYEYYIYRIIHKEHYIEMKYYHWNKKKSLKLDLLKIEIELSKRGSNLSVLDSIHFKEGKNKLLEIHQEKGLHKKFWTEEKVKEMYEILVNLQKEVKEKYGNDNDESNT